MSTRAIIIRKNDKLNRIEYGQTKWDGYANTEILNAGYTDPAVVDQLFTKLIKCGICNLGDTIDRITWYKDSYNCGTMQVLDNTRFRDAEDWLSNNFDWPEYVSLWDGEKWIDYEMQYNEDNGNLSNPELTSWLENALAEIANTYNPNNDDNT